MSRTTTLIAAAAALSLAVVLPSQSIDRFVGTLRATATGFGIDETSLPVVAANADLRQFVGRIVEMTGQIRSDVAAPFYEVASIEQAGSWFQSSGDTRVGRDIQFRIDVPDIGRWYLYAALAPAMMPLESYMPYGSGTLWIDPGSILTLGLGPMVRTWADRMTVPNDPALVGLQVWFQGAVHIIPGPLKFLNANRVTLLP